MDAVDVLDGGMMSPSAPAAMLAALTAPPQLQIFAAMVAATGPGRQQHRQQHWPYAGTRISYLTPTGAAGRTGLSRAAALDAFRALEAVGPACPHPDDPDRMRVAAGPPGARGRR